MYISNVYSHFPFIFSNTVHRINAIKGITWKAEVHDRFKGQPLGAAKELCGVHSKSHEIMLTAIREGKATVFKTDPDVTLPEVYLCVGILTVSICIHRKIRVLTKPDGVVPVVCIGEPNTAMLMLKHLMLILVLDIPITMEVIKDATCCY